VPQDSRVGCVGIGVVVSLVPDLESRVRTDAVPLAFVVKTQADIGRKLLRRSPRILSVDGVLMELGILRNIYVFLRILVDTAQH
jgi:hypothetical protein